jgi:hypothetical protein
MAVVVLLVAVGAAGALVALRSGAGSGTPAPSGAAEASASIRPGAGVLVFSDDFHDPASGWMTDTLASGTTYKYTDRGFEIFAKGALHHISTAPYGRPRLKVAVAVTATQSTPAPDAAGFGVTCDRGTGSDEIRYEFIAYADGTWSIERLDGPLSATGDPPTVLKQGALAGKPGPEPMTVEGVCVLHADEATTDLTLYINGAQMAGITDTAGFLADTGWYAELLVSSDDPPTTVTVTKFEVRTVP